MISQRTREKIHENTKLLRQAIEDEFGTAPSEELEEQIGSALLWMAEDVEKQLSK